MRSGLLRLVFAATVLCMVAMPAAVFSDPIAEGTITFENDDVPPYFLATLDFAVYAPGDPANPVDAGMYPIVLSDYTYVYTLSNDATSYVSLSALTVGVVSGASASGFGSIDDGEGGATRAPTAILDLTTMIRFMWVGGPIIDNYTILAGMTSKPVFVTSPSGPGDVPVVAISIASNTEDEIASGPFGGAVCGNVGASCPGVPPSPAEGIIVDLYDMEDNLLQTARTDADGDFCFYGLEPGDYVVSIVVPLSYESNPGYFPISVPIGPPITQNFELVCKDIVSEPRTIGFWKHQVGTALSGKGHQHIDTPTLCGYLDMIENRFNNNAINSVAIYDPPASGLCEDKLEKAQDILQLKGKVPMEWRAKQQLLALLFNVASEKISLVEAISVDGANVSQAITYCDNLIDDPNGDHERAKTIADEINNGRMVPAGYIPLDTDVIFYQRRHIEMSNALPTIFTKTTKITFMLGGEGSVPVDLKVFDVSGRLIRTVADRDFGPGLHSVVWDGRNNHGAQAATGVYFYSLTTPLDQATGKMILRR